MSIEDILFSTYLKTIKWSKNKLLKALEELRKKYRDVEKQNQELLEENKRLQAELQKKKIQKVNSRVNQPSSKQPEWEPKGAGNDGLGKKKKKGRGKKGRKGAGNKRKDLKPNRESKAEVNECDNCGKDLSRTPTCDRPNERIIEDIADIPPEPEIILEKQEKKYCNRCQKVTTAKSELALPNSDIGLNATVLVCYLWVASCLSFPKISSIFKTFFRLQVSTSGLSSMVIRISDIFEDVYEEILSDINVGAALYADETGWRIQGRNWWLWVFGTEDSAFFTIDSSRGSDVVRRVLGEIFLGVLVVDGWGAYLSIICEQQTCMAHLFRKIRKFRDAFPDLVSIAKFYVKLRKIIRDGERLQKNRQKLGEAAFQRRLQKLKNRLERLIKWPNPNDLLKEIIKKVKKQQPRILTFVEHKMVKSHNNFAELLIRKGVLKRKVSGGSKSPIGAAAYAVLLSIFVTCGLRGISFSAFMKESLKEYIRTGKPMLLKEYSYITNEQHILLKAA